MARTFLHAFTGARFVVSRDRVIETRNEKHTTKRIRRDFARVDARCAVTFCLDFCQKPAAAQSGSISEMSEILPKNLEPYEQTVTTGAKKV